MRNRKLTILLSILTLVCGGSALADSIPPAPAGQWFVPTHFGGVPGAFNALSKRGDALAIFPATGRAGTTCKHYQGVTRVNGPDGTPYLIMTKSGNASVCVLEDDEPGWLIVLKLGSRPKDGERMGSNVLPYGSTNHSIYPVPLPTFEQDRAVAGYRLDGNDVAASFRHPGGIQAVGNMIAVGAEGAYNDEPYGATILFFDVTNPEQPTLTSKFHVFDSGAVLGADPIGITPIKAADGQCCRYLMVASGGDGNEKVRFYISQPDPGKTTTTLSSPNLTWAGDNRAFSAEELSDCIGQDWPTAGLIPGGQHQMLNLVREGSLDGPIYMIGGRRDGTIVNPFVDEYLDLYRVNINEAGIIQDCPFTHVATKTVDTDAWANEGTTSTFSAAGGAYVSPSGELIVYNSKHDLTIKADLTDPANPIALSYHISMGEYRIGSLVRSDSPLLRPTATVDGPYAVDEGSSVSLTGHGKHARQKAFAELFQLDGVGRSLPGWLDDDEWLAVDYDIKDLDHFDSLDELGGAADDIWDRAGSLRWFAPQGCTIWANDYPARSSEWPGPDTVLLRGTGGFEEATNLDAMQVYTPSGSPYPQAPVPANFTPVTINYDNDIEGVTFAPDCDTYYAATMGLEWDLDGNGSYEANGSTVAFDAFALDGPSVFPAKGRARHPSDATRIGMGDPIAVPVEVRNVPPVIGSFTVTDSLGHDLAGGTTPLIVGLPATVTESFTDPGRPDTQTASIDWGDGSALDAAFATFTDAHNGATGSLVDPHTFVVPGTPQITSTITDDDGGATPQQATITVLSLLDALEDLADQLADMIATTTDPDVRATLQAALDALIGNNGGSAENGAIDKLGQNDSVAVIVKIKAAILALIDAENAGAGDLSGKKDLLGLVAEGIATGRYNEALASTPAPRPAQAKMLTLIATQITAGHGQLLGHDYANACDSLGSATSKALGLIRQQSGLAPRPTIPRTTVLGTRR